MNCMKCGRDTKEDAVFCEECLEHMERHPVPPNTLAYVPSEKDRASAKTHTTAAPVVAVEDQAKRLSKQMRVMIVLVMLLVIAVVLLTLLYVAALHDMDVARFIGKNYTAITSSGAPK